MTEPLSTTTTPPAPAPSASRKAFGNMSSLLFNDVMVRASSFALYAFIGHFLGTREFGQLSLGLSFFFTFQIFAVAGVKPLIAREVSKNHDLTDKYLVNASVLLILTALLAFLAETLLILVFNYDLETRFVIIFLGLCLLPVALIAVCESILIGREKMHFITAVNVPVNLAIIAVVYVLLINGGGLVGVCVTILLSYVVVLVAEWIFILRFVIRPKAKLDVGFMRSLLKQTSTFIWIDGLVSASGTITLLVLSKALDVSSVSLYSSSIQLNSPMMLIIVSMVNSIFPIMCRQVGKENTVLKQTATKLIEMAFSVAIPGAVGLFILADRILVFVYGQDDFANGGISLRIMVATLFARAIVHTLGQLLYATSQEKMNLSIVIRSTVIYFIASTILAWRFGVAGAALAAVISSVFDVVFHYLAVRRTLGHVAVLTPAVRPLVASLLMGLVLFLIPSSWPVLVTIIIGAAVYAVALAAIWGVTIGTPRKIFQYFFNYQAASEFAK